MYSLSTIVLLFMMGYTVCGQELSGTWRGNYGKSLLSQSIEKLEVDIELYNDSLIKGSTHIYYGGDEYEHYEIKGVFHKSDVFVYFTEVKEISVKLNTSNVMRTYAMQLSVSDTMMRLEGKWKENGNNLQMMATKVWLEKPIPGKTDTAKEVSTTHKKHADTVAYSTAPVERPVKIVKVIEIDSADADSLTIEITDNARIGNDMVSVFINDELVLHKQTISHNPLLIRTTLSKNNPESVIRMKAESYGSMPPCTARMSIITPQTSFVADVESNYATNGAIIIRLRK
jgi:hypothetical protein